ncbi:tail assembly protein [Stenotrophomonas maltophilia]|uniref:tail assembly protein n=1 Tax=Stenotrophomonas maltophilia TaxID=40324 RepID=UPI001EE458E0|nr:tail assembly protein [Stenotrophomonas maltophilia]
MRTIKLYGPMVPLFGREFRLAVNSPAEAVRALCAILPGFQQYLVRAKEQGIGFAVFVGKQNLTKEQLQDPPGNEDIRLAPVLLGSKRGGILNIIMGVVLIVVGVYTNNVNLIVQGGVMVVGGVVQMLGPQPKGLGSQDSVENRPSYSMNGTVNTQAQGNPVPVAYGGHDQKGMLVGSAVISGGIMAGDQL